MMRSCRGGTLDRRICPRRWVGESGNRAPLAEALEGPLTLAGSILDILASLRDRPRPIDRYIDYFGGAPLSTR